MREWAASRGVALDLTTPRTSEQNGIAESAIRAVDGKSRVSLCQSGLSESFWEFSVMYATHVLNRCLNSCSMHSVTPIECFSGLRPDVG